MLLKPPYLGVLPRDREENPRQALVLETSTSWYLMPVKSIQDKHVCKKKNKHLLSLSHLCHIRDHPESDPNKGQQRQPDEAAM